MSAHLDTAAPQETSWPEHPPELPAAWTWGWTQGWTLIGLLRTGGTAALVAALAQFLLIGVNVDNDLQRFGLLLLQTGLFTGGAFVLQRVLQDTKSARLLIGVSLVSVVAGFAVLGAMFHATFALDGTSLPMDDGALWSRVPLSADALPAITQWRTGSAVQTLLAALAAALVLLPTARFGFAVLARNSAQRLTVLTAMASLTLLVPVRDPMLMGLLAAATLLGVSAAQRGMADRDPALATAEGRFARAIPFLPVGIVIARSVLLHEIDASLVLTLALAAWWLVRTGLAASSPSAWFQSTGYAVGMVAIATAAVTLSVMLEPVLDSVSLVLMTLIGSLGTLELRRHASAIRAVSRLDAVALLLAGLMLGALTTVGSALQFPDAWLIAATLPLVGYAALTRRPVLVGLLLLLVGWQSLVMVEHLLTLLHGRGWQSLIGLGLVAIASAGWMERRRSTPVVDGD